MGFFSTVWTIVKLFLIFLFVFGVLSILKWIGQKIGVD